MSPPPLSSTEIIILLVGNRGGYNMRNPEEANNSFNQTRLLHAVAVAVRPVGHVPPVGRAALSPPNSSATKSSTSKVEIRSGKTYLLAAQGPAAVLVRLVAVRHPL